MHTSSAASEPSIRWEVGRLLERGISAVIGILNLSIQRQGWICIFSFILHAPNEVAGGFKYLVVRVTALHVPAETGSRSNSVYGHRCTKLTLSTSLDGRWARPGY